MSGPATAKTRASAPAASSDSGGALSGGASPQPVINARINAAASSEAQSLLNVLNIFLTSLSAYPFPLSLI